jgi:hypothetical protein
MMLSRMKKMKNRKQFLYHNCLDNCLLSIMCSNYVVKVSNINAY